jgi:hypothetical protein
MLGWKDLGLENIPVVTFFLFSENFSKSYSVCIHNVRDFYTRNHFPFFSGDTTTCPPRPMCFLGTKATLMFTKQIMIFRYVQQFQKLS